MILVEGACLDENTEILMSDYSSKKIKDVNIGDEVISGDLSKQHVLAQTKLLKETITLKTKTSEVTCGRNHKLNVYDTLLNKFNFVEAITIMKEQNRYKIVKSKINNETESLIVITNTDKKISLENGIISYTDDDYFIIIRNNVILKIHGIDIQKDDLIIFS